MAEVVPVGTALTRAQALAEQLCHVLQLAMLSDRRSLWESPTLPVAQALRHEVALAAEAKRLEAASGALHFTEREGRHGH